MRPSALGIAALREYGRRHPIALPTAGKAREAAATIRSWFYPKQRAFFCSRARWRATCKTRRAGATAGGVRELLARALEVPGFRATYVSKTNVDARDRAWTNDNKSGFLDVVRELGSPTRLKRQKLEAVTLGGVTIKVRDGAMKLDFSNGSQIEVFGANNIGRQSGKRGAAKHVFWIDEAQDFPGLDDFIAVISPAMRDFGGECWLTGTPGRDCAGLFYEVTKEETDGDARPPGWEVHTIAVVDNPYFGHVVTDSTADGEAAYFVEDNLAHDKRLSLEERATHRHGPYFDADEAERAASTVRWDVTAGAEKLEKGLKGDEPDFVREWLGRWVKTDARYVYPVHAVPRHQLLFAPQRLADNPFVGTHPRFDGHPPWYDHHAAVRDLPRLGRDRRPHKWLYSLWLDDGFFPDPFAIMLWAFTPTLPDVYEMFSWKMTRVDADDKSMYVKRLYDSIPEVVSFGGDAAGMKGDFAVWKRRLNLPVEEAEKSGKNALEEMLANDIRRARVHFRDGSPIVTEMRHLVYLPGKPGKPRQVHKHRAVAGVVHGDHCCFVAGTKIALTRGMVPIEQVRIGDVAHTRLGQARPVTAAFSVGERDTWRMETDAVPGAALTGTADHPIWTARGWVPLGLLMPGNEVEPFFSWDTTRPTLVRSVEPTGKLERVYNLTVAVDHEYFANGILVSNCDAGRYGFAALTHYLAQIPGDKPAPGTRAAYQQEAEQIETKLDQQEARREEQLAAADELAEEYGREGYEW